MAVLVSAGDEGLTSFNLWTLRCQPIRRYQPLHQFCDTDLRQVRVLTSVQVCEQLFSGEGLVSVA